MTPRASRILKLAAALMVVVVVVAVLVISVYLMGGSSGQKSAALPFDLGNVRARNVILLVGDGMGDADLTAARWEKSGRDLAAYQNTTLAMDRLDYAGRVRTSAADSLVTDSAAAITALMTGVKTNTGVIGQDATATVGATDGDRLATIAELAKRGGRTTGVVTNSRITHATPAGVYAHVNDRDAELVIARQLLGSGVDVALGGGYRYFIDDSMNDPWGRAGERSDGRDLVADARTQGYTVVTTASSLAAVHATPGGKVLGLFDTSAMEPELRRAGTEQPGLAEMTAKAIGLLDTDRDGFFLMVEGGQIDTAASARDYRRMANETLAFDDAVRTVLGFADENPDTLVIVTADHETGGLVLQDSNHGNMSGIFASGSALTRNDTALAFEETATHTAVDVPIMACGPGADRFSHGTLDNTQVFRVMRDAMGL